jgi:hypothetical protein
MDFADLEERARTMTSDQVDATLRQLMLDPRFAAVLRILQDQRGALVQTASAPATVAHASSAQIMAHCLGGVDALLAIEGRLHGAIQSKEGE